MFQSINTQKTVNMKQLLHLLTSQRSWGDTDSSAGSGFAFLLRRARALQSRLLITPWGFHKSEWFPLGNLQAEGRQSWEGSGVVIVAIREFPEGP